jgi:hypothetical protein
MLTELVGSIRLEDVEKAYFCLARLSSELDSTAHGTRGLFGQICRHEHVLDSGHFSPLKFVNSCIRSGEVRLARADSHPARACKSKRCNK